MNSGRRIVFGVFFICMIVSALTMAAIPSVSAFKVRGEVVRLPILMYHQISENPERWGKFVISPEEFEEDMKILDERGYTPITVNQLAAYTRGKFKMPKKPVMITFDDGYQSDYVYAFPILKKYQFKAVCSTVGAYTEMYSQNIRKHINYAHLSWQEMREMLASGLVEFQNHSYNLHNYDYTRKGCLKKYNESQGHYDKLLREDFEKSQQLFLENLGFEPICFTYPFGSTNDDLLQHVKDFGFLASLGTYERVNEITGNPAELYDLKRFNRHHGCDIRKILDKAENLP